MRIYILAGNHVQAKKFARDQQLGREGLDWVYVVDEHVFWGIRNPQVIKTGTWDSRRDLPRIEAVIRASAGTVREVVS